MDLKMTGNTMSVAYKTRGLFQQTFKCATSLMFWGCIGPTGVGKLVVCYRTVNA